MALNPESMVQVEAEVPWIRVAAFLNKMQRFSPDLVKIEGEKFPYETGTEQQLPEDYVSPGVSYII